MVGILLPGNSISGKSSWILCPSSSGQVKLCFASKISSLRIDSLESRPGEIKWHLMVASCYRRSGDYTAALDKYKWIHQHFPDDTDCKETVELRLWTWSLKQTCVIKGVALVDSGLQTCQVPWLRQTTLTITSLQSSRVSHAAENEEEVDEWISFLRLLRWISVNFSF